MNNNKIAIIFPAYNEEATINQVIKDFHNEFPDAFIYVIDNNSKDDTNKIAHKAYKELTCNGELLFVKEQGKANAIRYAHSYIDADFYVMVDADLTYSAKDLHKLLTPLINNEADMVVGDRISEGKYAAENTRAIHGLGNSIVKNLINYLFKASLNDIMTGYRACNKKFIKNYPVLCEGFELETDMSIHALHYRYRILEVPINYCARPDGSISKLNTYRDGFKVLKTIFWIFKDYRPLIFFSTLSLVFCFCGLLAGVFPIHDYITTKEIEHFPLAILASGLMIFSVSLLIAGFILDTIVRLHRFNYEIKFLKKH